MTITKEIAKDILTNIKAKSRLIAKSRMQEDSNDIEVVRERQKLRNEVAELENELLALIK